MSFQSPWMLLGLLVVAAFVGLSALGRAAPRALRGSVHQPRRSRDRGLGPVVAALRAGGDPRARPRRARRGALAAARGANAAQGEGDGHPRGRHVTLHAGQGRRADAPRRSAGGASHVPRPGAGRPAGRPRGVRRRGAGGDAAEGRSRGSWGGSRSPTIDEFLVFGGTAIGDALQTAVLLGRQVTDLVPEEGSTAAPALSDSTRSLAQANEPESDVEEEESPVSILFLSDGAQTRGLLQPLEGAQLAKEANFPVFTVALGTPDGVIERGPFGGFPGQDSGELHPRPPGPRDAARDRRDHRR